MQFQETFVSITLAALLCLVANAPVVALVFFAHVQKQPNRLSSTFVGLVALALPFTLELLAFATVKAKWPEQFMAFSLALIVTHLVLWSCVAFWAWLKVTR